MNLKFEYSKEKDIWCLLTVGKRSRGSNAPYPSKVYEELVAMFGDNPDVKSASLFIDQYLKNNNYDIPSYIDSCQKEWSAAAHEFEKIAEKVFGLSLSQEITVYPTVNNRCPYSTEENNFFVSFSSIAPIKTMMHELWHFYTWYKFGISEESKIGPEKYNDIKEALTVLLNVECKHLWPEGLEDKGYTQHQELRGEILKLWQQNPDINLVWDKMTS